MRVDRQRGFSLLELIIVLAVVLIVAAITAPKMREIIDAQKLRGAAQEYAGLMQIARTRAAEDNKPYEIRTVVNGTSTTAFVDLNDDGAYQPTGDAQGKNPEPGIPLPEQITIGDTGAPQDFEASATLLGAIAIDLEDSPMLDTQGNAAPGIAFNERGLPCQRDTAGGTCKNSATVNAALAPIAWVTYFQYTRSGSGITKYAAVTVTPAGRIKTWTYQSNGQGGGSWR